MTDLAHLSAVELLQGYQGGDFSPVEATQAALERLEAQNPAVNAFILVDAEGALQEAENAAQRWSSGQTKGPLDGVPLSIKEHIDVKGWATRQSSPILPDVPAEADAPLTAHLRAAGSVILGKTATPEFCWKGCTDSALYGVSYNPWDNDKTPGGSSGGAAAACALGMGPLHVGTDGGGSVRIPAAFCGIFGLKPTQYRVPGGPGGPTAALSQAGPLTRTVADGALMYSVMAQPHAKDPFALPLVEGAALDLEAGVKGLKIAYWDGSRLTDIHPDIAAAIASAAGTFEDLGAEVVEADPGFENMLQTFLDFWQPVTAYYLDGASEEALAASDPMLVRSAKKGAEIPIVRHYQALAARGALTQLMSAFHQDFDLLIAPTTPVPPFKAERGVYGPEGDAYKRTWTPLTFPFNLTGQPAASVPCGFTQDGLPIGLQIVAPWHQEARIFHAARAFEQVHPFKMPAV